MNKQQMRHLRGTTKQWRQHPPGTTILPHRERFVHMGVPGSTASSATKPTPTGCITRDGILLGVFEGYGLSPDPAGDFWLTEGTVMQPQMHVAFSAENKTVVDAFFQAGLDAGGTDNGAPGLRPQYHGHYYAAFIRDPDGYNIEAVYHKA